ncbi:MAG: cell division protein FtsA [Candidatus Omnitrophica bacterium]|nr:cell division protein FtsA [Candidatus Omnitrophota bacterium]
MAKEKIITALDIGASKVCCLIAAPGKNDQLDVLGYGLSHHDCLNRGVVTDIKGLSEAISKAVYEAEEISGKKVQSAVFNISGTHMKGIASHGQILISDRDNEITRRDVDRAIANAKSIHMPYERDIVYSVRKDFTVDGEKGIVNPAGMFGMKLETDLYLVTAKISVIDNLKKAVQQAGIGIEDYVISGIATASSVLSQHDKDLGVVLVDIGADLTEILIFLEKRLSYVSILPSGGDNITKVVSDKLRIPEGVAERLKIENGSLEESAGEETITVKVDSHSRSISKGELKAILVSEYDKIFNSIKKELLNSGCAENASSGVVICGEPVMLDGCMEQAELALNFPVKMGHIIGLGTSPKPLPSHIYATSIGLLKYGSERRQSKKSILNMGPKNLVLAVADRARTLYYDYF